MGIACLIPHSFVHSTGEPKTSTSQILASTRIARGTCHSVLGPTPGVPDSVGLRWGLSIYVEWCCCWKIKFKNKNDEMLGSATGMWLGNLSFKNTRIQTQSPHTYSESDTIVTYLQCSLSFLIRQCQSEWRISPPPTRVFHYKSALYKILQLGLGVLRAKPLRTVRHSPDVLPAKNIYGFLNTYYEQFGALVQSVIFTNATHIHVICSRLV